MSPLSTTTWLALIPADNSNRYDFLHWAARIYETEGFDESERDYKLLIAERLADARRALEAGEGDWLTRLRSAFGPPNNLTMWRAHDTFLRALNSTSSRLSASSANSGTRT